MPDRPIHLVYADALWKSSFGYPLYKPESSLALKPGICGALSSTGTWRTLMDLRDRSAVEKQGFKPFDRVTPAEPLSLEVGPFKSEQVQEAEAGASVKTSAFPGVNIGAAIELSFNNESGALLLTRGVTRDTVLFHQKYEQWCKDNARNIVEKWPEVKQHDIWIISETWCTEDYAISAWQNGKQSFIIGFEASVGPAGAVDLMASGKWRISKKQEHWQTPLDRKPDERFVVFFSGIRIRYRTILRDISVKPDARGPLRGPAFTILDPSRNDGSELDVKVEPFGNVEPSFKTETKVSEEAYDEGVF